MFEKIGSHSRQPEHFEIFQLLDTWLYQSLVILIYSFVVALILNESDDVCLLQWHNPAERDLRLTKLSAIISSYLVKFLKHINITQHEIVIVFSSFYFSETTIDFFSIKVPLLPSSCSYSNYKCLTKSLDMIERQSNIDFPQLFT